MQLLQFVFHRPTCSPDRALVPRLSAQLADAASISMDSFNGKHLESVHVRADVNVRETEDVCFLGVATKHNSRTRLRTNAQIEITHTH